MRLWSLHPRYLDVRGLAAVWREGLLAQAVLAGQTRGYTRHPQLTRFRDAPAPENYIAAYLRAILAEAGRRGYRFDASKIRQSDPVEPLLVTQGQLAYEWRHLNNKLKYRAPTWFSQLPSLTLPEPHPLFQSVPGDIADWEITIGNTETHASKNGKNAK
jgi:hypothetical protein